MSPAPSKSLALEHIKLGDTLKYSNSVQDYRNDVVPASVGVIIYCVTIPEVIKIITGCFANYTAEVENTVQPRVPFNFVTHCFFLAHRCIVLGKRHNLTLSS